MIKPFYDDGTCVVYHADNRAIVPMLYAQGARFFLLLTDPPYGINVAKKGCIGSGSKRGNVRTFKPSDWDKQTADGWLMDGVRSLCKWQVIWGGNHYAFPHSACWFVWDKKINGDFADCELAWTNLPRAIRKFEFTWNGMIQENMKEKEVREHECQKPVALMSWCLEQVLKVQALPEGAVVLDPWMGSGPVLRACKDRKIKCVGIEGNIEHCETAVRKLSQEVLLTETETEKGKSNVDREQVGLL